MGKIAKTHEKASASDESSAHDSGNSSSENSSSSSSSSSSSDSDSSSDDEEETKLFKKNATKETPKVENILKQEEIKKDEEEAQSEIAAIRKQVENDANEKIIGTIYIEGIPYKANEGDIVSHFSQCGIVKEVRMPRYQDSGKPRGYAHVVFESEEDAFSALKLDGEYMMGRYLTIRMPQKPKVVEEALSLKKSKFNSKGCRTVFVKHLPYDVDEAIVKESLKQCGEIVNVRLPLWNHTGKLKGFGYVEFTTEEGAKAAKRRSGIKIGGRMVIIDFDGGAPKASFRKRDGQYWQKGEEGKAYIAKKMSSKSRSKRKPDQRLSKRARLN